MKAYFISGLAADSRVFKYIKLPDGYEPVYLEWITPQPNESLKQYALRLAQHISTGEDFILVGLSMGGMIAVEIANQLHPQKVILISSISCASQLPFYFRGPGRLGLYKLIPVSLVQHAAIIKRLFTAETEEDKKLLRQIIRDSDPAFIKWAMGAIVHWDNDRVPQNLIHIHGSSDELLPVRFAQPNHIIAKGGHLMVMTRAEEINSILGKTLAGLIRS